jgi:nitroreductase
MAGSLDEIILSRRSVRVFTEVRLGEEEIKAILQAGLHAPYAALAVPPGEIPRRFIVLDGHSETLRRIRAVLKKRAGTFSRLIPFLNLFRRKKISPAFQLRLQSDPLGNAPYFILVIEPKGFPPTVKQSLAHCMQNMWLKATELGLGFRLVSIFENMGNDRELCRLLAIKKGRYGMNCCAIGFPAQRTEASPRDNLDDVTAWLRS